VAVTVFKFGDFKLDSDRFELYRAGRALKLERKPMELLVLLAAKNGNLVTRTEIAERLWGSEVFVDTEHGINTAIRKIREVLNDDPVQSRFVQTVTGKGYRFIGSIVELPTEAPAPAAEEQTRISAESRSRRIGDTKPTYPPSGTTMVQDRAPDPPDPPTNEIESPSEPDIPSPDNSRLRVWIAATTALALLIIAVSLGARSLRNRSINRAAIPKITSLAVLPLDNLSGDPAQNYFADGMTDELTTMLAKNSTLRIVSRTSAMQYKGAHRPLPDIARELGVDGVLEGSVERTGDKVHMTIQLIQAPTDTHLWAESYDRNANDVVTLPKEAAQTIAKQLGSAVVLPASARYVNPEAHDDYLRGRYLWLTGDNDKAGKYFKKATELQPDYAIGWAGLSMYYGEGTVDGTMPPKDALAQHEATAIKAVELDDSLPEAHLALWSVRFLNSDFERAEQEVVRAIELNPNYYEAWHFRAEMNAAFGRYEEAINFQKKAMELDPFERPHSMAMIYVFARQYDAAIKDLLARLETVPNDVGLHSELHVAYRSKGALKEATQEWEKVQLLLGNKAQGPSPETIRSAYQKGGYRAVLLEQLSYLKRKSAKQYVSPCDFAVVYAQLGDREETLSALEEAYRQHSGGLLWIQTESAYDFLHADKRYRAIIEGLKLPQATFSASP
jgi:TolB-like protein/DNA-binding winged helix-turn-helix (wHTH) protein